MRYFSAKIQQKNTSCWSLKTNFACKSNIFVKSDVSLWQFPPFMAEYGRLMLFFACKITTGVRGKAMGIQGVFSHFAKKANVQHKTVEHLLIKRIVWKNLTICTLYDKSLSTIRMRRFSCFELLYAIRCRREQQKGERQISRTTERE